MEKKFSLSFLIKVRPWHIKKKKEKREKGFHLDFVNIGWWF